MKSSDNYNYVNSEKAALHYFNEAGVLYSEMLNSAMEKIGMKYSYRCFLRPLAENESLTQHELSEITGMKAPTISITLRKMEREGIVTREKKGDMRLSHVSITEKGIKLYNKVQNSIKKTEKSILKGINKREIAAMNLTLEKIMNNILTVKK